MFSSMWNFVKRHRNKIAISSVVIGSGIFLTKFALRKLRQWEETEVMECYEVIRKNQHFETTQRTCHQTTYSLSSNLKSNIEALLDADSLINALKNKPPNKLEIWEDLKILSLTRPLVFIYSSSLLITLLKVQMNILGGYLYVEATYPKSKDDDVLSQEMQQKFLTVVHHLLDEGLKNLVNALMPIVKSVVGPLSLKRKLSLPKFEIILQSIRKSFEDSECSPTRSIPAYILGKLKSSAYENKLQKILNETHDVLNSEDCYHTFHAIVNSGFSVLTDSITGFYLDNDNSQQFVNPQAIEVPLAKLIPFLCNSIHTQCSSQPGSMLNTSLCLEKMSIFAANIYEAFCQVN